LIAVADTCFIIDWARYSNRHVLFKVFNRVLIPRQVLDEVRSEATIDFLATGLAEGGLVYYEPTPEVIVEADELVREILAKPALRRVELPEAVCLVMGRRYGYIVLTENLGALMAVKGLARLKGVTVWRTLEVLAQAFKQGYLKGDFKAEVAKFSRETMHIFREEDVERALHG